MAYCMLQCRNIYLQPGKVEQVYVIIDVKDIGITDVPKEVSLLTNVVINFK